MSSGRWWHAYGGLLGEGWGGAWALLVAGPSTTEPADLPDVWVDGHLRYLHSWDHEPSDHEKDLVTPEDYREPAPETVAEVLGVFVGEETIVERLRPEDEPE